MPRSLPQLAISAGVAPGVLTTTAATWFALVSQIVSEPYLDEVFHVRQALAYWSGFWHVWDPKITTPPGLYLVTWPWLKLQSLLDRLPARPLFFPATDSEQEAFLQPLRSVNILALLGLFVVTSYLQSLRYPNSSAAAITHGALNICLFPPIFFFSALYYTDLMAILLVPCMHLASIWYDGIVSGVLVTLVGCVGLLMRQTNVIWTGLYVAGAKLLKKLDKLDEDIRKDKSWWAIMNESIRTGCFYDPPMHAATVTDYVLVAITAFLASMTQISLLLYFTWPYFVVAGVFAGFAIVNKGIVLGDRVNHPASIHMPQILYIWPYMVFFSWPVILPALTLFVLSNLPAGLRRKLPKFFSTPDVSAWELPRFSTMLLLLAGALAAVHYNTLVHPFTLADNRHYTFYVFRLLLAHPAIKYAVTPIYISCAWACLGSVLDLQKMVVEALNRQILRDHAARKAARAAAAARSSAAADAASDSGAASGAEGPDSKLSASVRATRALPSLAIPPPTLAIPADFSPGGLRSPPGGLQSHASWFLLWLGASAVTLCTAPLVEPRYFIIPWMLWRMHIPFLNRRILPSTPTKRNPDGSDTGIKKNTGRPSGRHLAKSIESGEGAWMILGLETLWYLSVNALVGYMFLYRPFEWGDQPGQQGRAQRFMW